MTDSESTGVIFVLLLGSYDCETRRVLYMVKEEIAKYSTYLTEYIMPLLLESVELYESREGVEFIVERLDGKATVMMFEGN